MLLVVRDYVAQRERLPGCRQPNDRYFWPNPARQRTMGANSASSSTSEYTSTRRSLLHRYAIPWLRRFHDLNRPIYSRCLYKQCLRLSHGASSSHNLFEASEDPQINVSFPGIYIRALNTDLEEIE